MLRTKVSFQKGAGAGLTDSPGQSQERPDPTCLPASCGLLAMLSAVCDDRSGRPRLMLALLWRGMAPWLAQSKLARKYCPTSMPLGIPGMVVAGTLGQPT